MTNREAAVAARQLITEMSEASVNFTLPRITALIPTALRRFREKVEKNPSDRALLMKSISITFSSGTFDLTNYVNGTTNQIDLREIRNTTLYSGSPKKPLTWLGSKAQLNNARQLDADAVAVFLDGYTLRTRNTDGLLTSFASAVTFEIVDFPSTIPNIPPQLEEYFVMCLAELAMGQVSEKKK